MRRLRQRLGAARRELGLGCLPAGPDFAFWTSPWATLLLTAPALEAPRDPLPERTFYIGPCLDRTPQEFVLPPTARPRVYLSLGTVFNNRPSVYRRAVQALRGRYQLIVSAGASYARLEAEPEVHLYRRVPQLAVLRQVDAVVSHGGNNSVNETLAAGKPLLVLPVGGEQGDNASRVVYLGAGLRARLGARVEEIRARVVNCWRAPATEPGLASWPRR